MTVAILGSGAFGTALAIALSQDNPHVTLWSRDPQEVAQMNERRMTGRHLPDLPLPRNLHVTGRIPEADIMLIAVPAQIVRSFLEKHKSSLGHSTLISCAKGIERKTGLGPVDVIRSVLPDARAGCLTGPSFAIDIAQGLPTALVLAMDDGAAEVQSQLTRPTLRIYRSNDVIGVQLGGALKNVVAIAAGITMGSGLGDSARASVIARGFAEISRYAKAKGAQSETIQGLSGLGDLVLTCMSEKSRNFAAGMALGRGDTLDPSVTVEGVATAQALTSEAAALGIDMPLCEAIAAVTEGRLDIPTAIKTLLQRPAGEE